jgi:hypothetical protein
MITTVPVDSANPEAPKSERAWLRWIGPSLWLALTILLCVTNVLTLLDHNFRDKAYGVVMQIAVSPMTQSIGLASVQRLLETRSSAALERQPVQRATTHLEQTSATLQQENKMLRGKYAKLSADRNNLSKQLRDSQVALVRHKERVAKLGTRVSSRATRSMARRLAALPGQALPGLSATVAAGSVILDIQDACESLKDIDDLSRSAGVTPPNRTKVCGRVVPSPESLLKEAQENWRQVYDNAADAINTASAETFRTRPKLIPVLEPKKSYEFARKWIENNLGQ